MMKFDEYQRLSRERADGISTKCTKLGLRTKLWTDKWNFSIIHGVLKKCPMYEMKVTALVEKNQIFLET